MTTEHLKKIPQIPEQSDIHGLKERTKVFVWVYFLELLPEGYNFVVEKEVISGKYKPFGGAKDIEDVDPEGALLREIEEELGLQIDPKKLIKLQDSTSPIQLDDGTFSKEEGHIWPWAYIIEDTNIVKPTVQEREIGDSIVVTPEEFKENAKFVGYVEGLPGWMEEIEEYIAALKQ